MEKINAYLEGFKLPELDLLELSDLDSPFTIEELQAGI